MQQADFCNENNIKYAAEYINDELISKGVLDEKLELPVSDKEVPSIINTLYTLIQDKARSDSAREALIEQSRRIESEGDHLRNVIKDTQIKLANIERTKSLVENQVVSLQNEMTLYAEKLKFARDEASKTRQAIKNVKTQCSTELRKKEKEIIKMQERMNKLTDEKLKSKSNLIYEVRNLNLNTSSTFTNTNIGELISLPSFSEEVHTDVWKSLAIDFCMTISDILISTLQQSSSDNQNFVRTSTSWRKHTLDLVTPEMLRSAFDSIILQVDKLSQIRQVVTEKSLIPTNSIQTKLARLEKENLNLRSQIERYETAVANISRVQNFPEFEDDLDEDD